MKLKDLDLVVLSKLTSQQVDQVTCLQCCKPYTAPQTAVCGHTLCHTCWTGQRVCPLCAGPCERKNLKSNQPVHNLTKHVQSLRDSFEKLFNIKLEEFLLDTVEIEPNDPTKHVKEWLASSQNHFSAPAQSSELSSEDLPQNPNPLEVSSSKIQIHNNSKKTTSPEKVVHVSLPQDDWDKIEAMPDAEDIVKEKDKENVVGPMDIEPFFFDENEYTTNNPRRSSRKRDMRNDSNLNNNDNSSLDKLMLKDSSGDTDLRSNKTKQNWNNVKRMRKEFSKLNKKNRNKLNVSIEMCKKTQNTGKPNTSETNANSPTVYEIDENTPNLFNNPTYTKNVENMEVEPAEINKPKETNEKSDHSSKLTKIIKETSNTSTKSKQNNKNTSQSTKTESVKQVENIIPAANIASGNKSEPPKMPFYKKGSLYPNSKVVEKSPVNIVNHNIDANTGNTNDDIEITIRVGNTITNVVIKKKNEIELKVNTDREVQTSFVSQNVLPDNDKVSQAVDNQNIHINISDGKHVTVEPCNPQIEKLKKQASLKTTSDKKNTDSADTATAQFEITESVEKELSNIMECAENGEEAAKQTTAPSETSKIIDAQKSPSNPGVVDNFDDFNDIDIFESDSVKEFHVETLKNSKQCPSEILMPTYTSKNRTQKQSKKRDRDENDNADSLSKRVKLDLQTKTQVIKPATNIETTNQKEANEITDSEPMNYDSVMGQVFANIDADIEEIKKTQTDKNACVETTNEKGDKRETQNDIHGTIIDISTQNFNELCNQKESENVFSVCMEKDDKEVEVLEPVPQEVPTEPQPEIGDYLTPVVIRNTESVIEQDMNDDSDKSVVEETPQKTTSFTKKQKNNGASKDLNESQRVAVVQKTKSNTKALENENVKTIVNLTDTSIMDSKSAKDVTVIDNITRKNTLETPLTINKFVDQIKHKSTPVARKSLNFDSENDIDPEQTLCPTNVEVAKTTQEKGFLAEAFEKTPKTVNNVSRTKGANSKKFCIAGSCLSSAEIARVKLLCSRYKWTYVDRYCKELTHLVVGVDDENKSQRSVKYMCALAASKWIVSYEWVEKCLQSYTILNEQNFEALDSTGEAGPHRSRTSNKKLFKGIKFFCMEPFSVLDVDTLKEMLESSGGTVVTDAKEVKITEKTNTPALLLAEPENTQEDRFIYLAMELSIVPVNYEWVLNCLGSYTLGSIHDLLLCPSTILPKAIQKWPPELLDADDD